jgi:hypothetical protein
MERHQALHLIMSHFWRCEWDTDNEFQTHSVKHGCNSWQLG